MWVCPLGHPLWDPGSGDGVSPRQELKRGRGALHEVWSLKSRADLTPPAGKTLSPIEAPGRRRVQMGPRGWPGSEGLCLKTLKSFLVCVRAAPRFDLTLSTGLRWALLVSVL